ncbi:MAG: DM13 domain-containing protein [Dactylosporangium sp.]|nr:DM13 domain-containing protein [Dactylosporangium sp.]NNJ61039.1 DM13 domain-containing protein [Dactylosporangium sp.]
MWKRLLRTPLTWVFVIVIAVVGAGGLYWFQPWKLFVDERVNDVLPVVEVSPGASPPAAGGNRILAAGTFVTHEHETTGTAQIVALADGGRQLVLRDFATSNGPDLRVWLTDQAVVAGRAGWKVFDDGTWTELATLKGNRGDQVYDIPATVDLAEVQSVSIWCKRFAVSFGAAELRST